MIFVLLGIHSLTVSAQSVNQWQAQYFNNTSFQGNSITKYSDQLNFDWGLGSPDNKINTNNFSAIFTTTITSNGGLYELSGGADDNISINVNGEDVFELKKAGNHSFNTYANFKKGENQVVVKYKELTGRAKVSLEIQPVQGWSVKYYNNLEQKGSPIYDVTDRIKYNWKSKSPHPEIQPDNFSVVFEKEMQFVETKYRIAGQFDDALAVYIDDKKVYDHQKGGRNYANETFNVSTGSHKVKMIYKEYTGAASIYVQLIPASTWGIEYYNSLKQSGFPALSTAESLSFNWGAKSPGTAVVTDNFTAKLYKSVQSDGGFYQITGSVDDLLSVKINGNVVYQITDPGNHSFNQVIQLPNGKSEIELAYTEYTGSARLQFDLKPVQDWLGAYYRNTTFEGNAHYLVHKELDLNFGKKEPNLAGFPSDSFSASYTKTIDFTGGYYELIGESDDLLNITVGKQEVLDIDNKGHNKYRELVYIAPGKQEVVVKFVEYSGNALVKLKLNKVDTTNKWLATYYPNTDFKGQAIKKAYDQLNLNFGNGSPSPGIPTNNFSAVFTKDITFKHSGYYVVSGASDDTINVNIAGQDYVSVNKPGSHKFKEIIYMEKGTYPTRVEFQEFTGGAKISLDIEPYMVGADWIAEYYKDDKFESREKVGEMKELAELSSRKDGFFDSPRSVSLKKKITVSDGIYNLTGHSDGVVEVWIDQQLIDVTNIGQSFDTSVQLTKGEHQVELKYSRNTSKPAVSFAYDQKPSANEWTSYYYPNDDYGGIPIVESSKEIRFDWGGGSPHKAIPNNYFTAIFEKTMKSSKGIYRVMGQVDDTIKILVNGKEAFRIDTAGSHQFNTTIQLPNDVNEIKVYFGELTGAAKIKVDLQKQLEDTYTSYGVTLDEMLNKQMKVSTPPQTDKYRNIAPWVHQSQLHLSSDTVINSNGVAARNNPNDSSDKAVKIRLNSGDIVKVVEKGVKGFSFNGGTEWYRIEYKNDAKLYVHSTLVDERAKTAKINVEVLSNGTNLRSKPDLSSGNVIIDLEAGTQLEYVNSVNGQSVGNSAKWYQVKYKGKDAYIHTSVGNVSTDYYQEPNASSHGFGVLTTTAPTRVLKEKNGYVELAVYPVWRNAPKSDVKMALEPKDADKFQFLKLSQSIGVDGNQLNQFLVGKGKLTGHGEAFAEAGKEYSVNEIYLLSHALLETGNGESQLASGVEVGIDSKGVTRLVTTGNRDSLKQIKVVYNMYGIAAYDTTALESGAIYAYENNWTSPAIAIRGGADWISKKYIHHGSYAQDTLYKMRWNPISPGTHQYATDIGWVAKQVVSYQKYYDKLTNPIMSYDIPVYK